MEYVLFINYEIVKIDKGLGEKVDTLIWGDLNRMERGENVQVGDRI